MRVQVLSSSQSPLNEKRWALLLRCGHTLWITRTGKPKHVTVDCVECDSKPKRKFKPRVPSK